MKTRYIVILISCVLVICLSVLTIVIVAVLGSSDVETKVLDTPQGPVKGYKIGNIFEFQGIPYATSPKGQDKFKAPLPAPTWLKPLDAVDKKVICPISMVTTDEVPNHYDDDFLMTEDCLIANVYQPDTDTRNLSVVVYIHGGAFQLGHGNLMTPRTLVEQGEIIAVTFNYRLGVHGFLCLGTDDIPGNAGMKDQVALLKWVRDNIGSFGGNPDDVTIAGFSAGAASVDLLVLSEMTRGLFHKVIPESGAAPGVWSVQQDPVDIAKSYALIFDIDTDSIQELDEFYKTTPLEKLMIDRFTRNKNSTFTFVPCVERDIGSESFLIDAPLNILKKRAFTPVPMLIGFANMEGKYRLPFFNSWKDGMNENFSEYLPADLIFNSEGQREEFGNAIKTYYFGGIPVGDDTILGYVNYFSDVMFVYSNLQTVKYHVEAGNNNVFLYEYSYVDDNLLSMNPEFAHVIGADHCAQTMAILNTSYDNVALISEDYAKVRTMMREIWINFIKTGNPVPEATPEFPQGWPASSSEGEPHMSLDLSPELRGPLLQERMQFWDQIYDSFYRTPIAPE